MLKGAYRLYPGTDKEIIVPNAIQLDGLVALLAMMLQGDTSVVAPGANFYIGLCQAGDITKTLANLAGEPTSTGGYARQPVARNAGGWPTVELLNGNGHARSALVTFSCTGANFSGAVTNAFLASTLNNTGKLFSLSAAFPSAIQLTPGQTLPLQFDLFLN